MFRAAEGVQNVQLTVNVRLTEMGGFGVSAMPGSFQMTEFATVSSICILSTFIKH